MNINVGVVGSTGLVGYEVIKCLEELNDKRINIFCYSSSKSEGNIIQTEKGKYRVEKLEENSFKGLKYVIFASSNDISEKYVPFAIREGCIVIDNSSFFRMREDVPLVSIGSNDEDIFKHKGIIANPNCSTIVLVRSLKVIDELYGIKRVVVSTYQSVSGAGKEAIEEYSINQHIKLPTYSAFPYTNSKVHYSIKDNVIPQIDVFNLENGYSKEELKMTYETQKILNKKIELLATCIRVPTLRGHGESVYVETKEEVNIEKLKRIIKDDEYLELKDDLEKQIYPLVNECYYSKKAQIGRIRKDLFNNFTVHYFIVGDNLYLGAAYNAVMILDKLIKEEYKEEI